MRCSNVAGHMEPMRLDTEFYTQMFQKQLTVDQ